MQSEGGSPCAVPGCRATCGRCHRTQRPMLICLCTSYGKHFQRSKRMPLRALRPKKRRSKRKLDREHLAQHGRLLTVALLVVERCTTRAELQRRVEVTWETVAMLPPLRRVRSDQSCPTEGVLVRGHPVDFLGGLGDGACGVWWPGIQRRAGQETTHDDTRVAARRKGLRRRPLSLFPRSLLRGAATFLPAKALLPPPVPAEVGRHPRRNTLSCIRVACVASLRPYRMWQSRRTRRMRMRGYGLSFDHSSVSSCRTLHGN